MVELDARRLIDRQVEFANFSSRPDSIQAALDTFFGRSILVESVDRLLGRKFESISHGIKTQD